MNTLPKALQPMGAYRQFILCKKVPDPKRPGKTNKFPIDPATMAVVTAHDPVGWMTADEAIQMAGMLGDEFEAGFVFTEQDPFWFLDIDDCLGADGQWSELSQQLCAVLAGAAVEVSQSGTGLHLFGTGTVPEHGCKNVPLGIEFYTEGRFVMLSGINAAGDAGADFSSVMPWLVEQYFPNSAPAVQEDWRDGPVPEWSGPADDTILIGKIRSSGQGMMSVFGGKASFADLWDANEIVLARSYPASNDVDSYDRSSADAALAQHLAFWTGKDHARINRLMWQSALVRDKWTAHKSYLKTTITTAVSRQQQVYQAQGREPQSKPQSPNPQPPEARFTTGSQFMTAHDQVKHFENLVYVHKLHQVFHRGRGIWYKDKQFKVAYGGYTFSLDAENDRTGRDAWEAFTVNQAVRFDRVDGVCFRPDAESGAFVSEEGETLVNTYVDLQLPLVAGDASRFVNHIKKMLPNGNDAEIVLTYMAAVVQFPGANFQWAPVIQGAQGNGKSLLIEVLCNAVGWRYSHLPKPKELGNKFNAWMEGTIVGGVEEIKLTEHRAEILEDLKPMVTSNRITVQPKGIDEYVTDNQVKFLFLTNYKNAIPTDTDTRRYAIFYCAQQSRADINRDFPPGYHKDLYDWLRAGGFDICRHFLMNYPLDARYNPAGDCQTAPTTTSTAEAVELSRGSVEQEIQEAIDQGKPGFAGGWISAFAVDKLLEEMRMDRRIPRNRRRELLQALGYDWHPALDNGRVNNAIPHEGGKPRLYIKSGHLAANLRNGGDIIRAYCSAQNYVEMGVANHKTV